MDSIQINKVQKFLDNVTNEGNISILSALFNISDYNIYVEIIDLLVDGKVSLASISNLDIIDNSSIETFIRQYKNRLNPVVGMIGDSNSFNAYKYLLEDYTYLSDFIKDFNMWKNNNIPYINNFVSQRISIPNVTYSASNGSVYSSKQDFIASFNSSVLPKLLSYYNVTDISHAVPSYTPSSNLSDKEKNILTILWSFITASFNGLNNSNAYRFTVELPDDTSFLREYFIPLHNIINFIKYSNNIDNLLVYCIQHLGSKGSGFSEEEINAMQDEMLNIASNNSLSLSDKLSFMKFYGHLINQYKANNSIAVSIYFISDLEIITNKIEELKVFFNIMYTYTTENMYLLG